MEDSLEHTFSCVPKVQGVSRISQANGQSVRECRTMFVCAVLDGTAFLLTILKEGITYVRKTVGLHWIRF